MYASWDEEDIMWRLWIFKGYSVWRNYTEALIVSNKWNKYLLAICNKTYAFHTILQQTSYFKDRKSRETGFKFREIYFWNKIYGKIFWNFLIIFIFNGNNFREWLEKMNIKSFQIFSPS